MDFIRTFIKNESDKFVLETSEARLAYYEKALAFLKNYRSIIFDSIHESFKGASDSAVRQLVHENVVYQSVNELIGAVILIEDNYCQSRLDSLSETLLAYDFDFDYVKDYLIGLGFDFVLNYGLRDSYNGEVHDHPSDHCIVLDISGMYINRYVVNQFVSYLIEHNIGDNVHHVALDVINDVTLYELSLITKYDSDFVDFLYEFFEDSDEVKSKLKGGR